MKTVASVPVQPQQQAMRSEPRIDERIMQPGKYEVTPDDTFPVRVLLQKSGKRWLLRYEDGDGVEEETAIFRMWSYDEMIELRKTATIYDQIRRSHMVDGDMFNRLKLQKLLVSWTFDRENPRLKLHRINGVLTDESWRAVSRLQPNILVFLIESMNRVLEGF